jgi:NTE family protein
MIDYFVPHIRIEDTRIPFHAVATDLVSCEEIIFSTGSLRRAVMASCAVPGAVEPLRDGDRLLSDGGICSMVPAHVARKRGADTVIAVVVDRSLTLQDELRTGKDIYARASDVMSRHLVGYDLAAADIVIRPDVGNLQWADFSQALHLIEAGAKAARDNLHAIRHATSGVNRWFPVKKILRSILEN